MVNLTNKSVLVIGWEYPPRMVGGLAVATHGIVKALSHFINVKLIVPFKDKNTPIDQNVTVYGLNNILDEIEDQDFNDLMKTIVAFDKPQEISSYPLLNSNRLKFDISGQNPSFKNGIDYLSLFKSDEVYGWGLWEKMNAFKEALTLLTPHISFDIIHCHDWVTFSAGMAVKMVSGKPLALHVHALETDRVGTFVHNKIYHIEQKAMEVSDIIFPVSEYTKQCIIENYGIREDKIRPIHNAIDQLLVQRWRHLIPQKIVTFLGRITSQKGPIFLLETIIKVIEVYKNIRFVIAGSGDMYEYLLMNSSYQQLSKYILFTGFIKSNEVNALLATSDVYFMPSVSEPFGLTALEAARAGVPCVITKQSGAAEVLTSALQADFWDTDKFADYIIELLVNDELHAHIANKQKQEISNVSWNISGEKIIKEYCKLLD